MVHFINGEITKVEADGYVKRHHLVEFYRGTIETKIVTYPVSMIDHITEEMSRGTESVNFS